MINISEVTGRFTVACKKEDRQIMEEFVKEFNNITSKWYYNIIISDKYNSVSSKNFITNRYGVEYCDMDDYISIEYNMMANDRWGFDSNINWISCRHMTKEVILSNESDPIGHNTVINIDILDLYKRYAEKFSDKIFIKLDYVDHEPGCGVIENGNVLISISKNQYPVVILEYRYVDNNSTDYFSHIIHRVDGIRLYGYILDNYQHVPDDNGHPMINKDAFMKLYNTVINNSKYDELVNYITSNNYRYDNTDIFEKYNILDKYDELLTKSI